MEPLQFIYWLQGYAEVSGATAPTSEQWQIIKDHLALVLEKKTPTYTSVPNYPIGNPPPFNPHPNPLTYPQGVRGFSIPWAVSVCSTASPPSTFAGGSSGTISSDFVTKLAEINTTEPFTPDNLSDCDERTPRKLC